MKVPCLNVVLQKLYCLTTGTVYVILKSMSIDPTDNLPEPSMVKVDKHVHTHTGFNDSEEAQRDWVFQNYTFKRFEGLTMRGHLRV